MKDPSPANNALTDDLLRFISSASCWVFTASSSPSEQFPHAPHWFKDPLLFGDNIPQLLEELPQKCASFRGERTCGSVNRPSRAASWIPTCQTRKA
jgi:hypothetical protein